MPKEWWRWGKKGRQWGGHAKPKWQDYALKDVNGKFQVKKKSVQNQFTPILLPPHYIGSSDFFQTISRPTPTVVKY
jgi:hypothetical protein